jgi:hypothetical protein
MHHYVVFGVFQVVLKLLLEVLLLHLLVSILEHIHAHVSAVYDSERLKAKCRLIHENEVLIGRAKLFSQAKYVVRVEAQQPH